MTIVLAFCLLMLAWAMWLMNKHLRETHNYSVQTVNDCNTNLDIIEHWLKSHSKKLKAIRVHLKLDKGYEDVGEHKKKGMKYIDGPNGWVPVNPVISGTYDVKQLAADLGCKKANKTNKNKGKK